MCRDVGGGGTRRGKRSRVWGRIESGKKQQQKLSEKSVVKTHFPPTKTQSPSTRGCAGNFYEQAVVIEAAVDGNNE